MNTTEEILNRALELSVGEREDLVHKLLLSLQPELPAGEWDCAWGEEIKRRLDQLERGEVTSRDAWESLDEMRRSLQSRKSS